MKISTARDLAFTILLRLESPSTHADELLQSPVVDRLNPADRNLVTALVMETLRWQILLDQQIRSQLTKPNQKLDREVLIALRLGAVQLLLMDRIPDHAAIDESVELTKKSGHRYSAGLVNAVLRKLTTQTRAESESAHDAASLAAATAHPQWMVERWVSDFGLARTIKICEANQQQPEAHFRAFDETLQPQLSQDDFRPGALLTSALRTGKKNVTEEVTNKNKSKDSLNALRRMDEGSQLVAELAGHGQRILDCCAAPGGKTLILVERNPNSRITACDISAARLNEMKLRIGISTIEFLEADATALEFHDEFDRVLCDVPCSGTGTLSRNPEIRHRLTVEDLARQSERQQRILVSAFRALRPGGRLVYSTCSLEREENEDVVEKFLAVESSAQVVSVTDRLREMDREGILQHGIADRLIETAITNSCLRTLPGTTLCDGFFAAILTKI